MYPAEAPLEGLDAVEEALAEVADAETFEVDAAIPAAAATVVLEVVANVVLPALI
jgi:hypothetical protein